MVRTSYSFCVSFSLFFHLSWIIKLVCGCKNGLDLFHLERWCSANNSPKMLARCLYATKDEREFELSLPEPGGRGRSEDSAQRNDDRTKKFTPNTSAPHPHLELQSSSRIQPPFDIEPTEKLVQGSEVKIPSPYPRRKGSKRTRCSKNDKNLAASPSPATEAEPMRHSCYPVPPRRVVHRVGLVFLNTKIWHFLALLHHHHHRRLWGGFVLFI